MQRELTDNEKAAMAQYDPNKPYMTGSPGETHRRDDLVVGRCEGLGDAKIHNQSFGGGILGLQQDFVAVRLPISDPVRRVSVLIDNIEAQAKAIQAKLDALYALRAKLADPECAKAVKDALELLR